MRCCLFLLLQLLLLPHRATCSRDDAAAATTTTPNHHHHLRRKLQTSGKGFNQTTLIKLANDLYCTPDQYTQDFVITVTLDQTPVSTLPPSKQCTSACDCRMRCCSNYPYYVDAEIAAGGGEGGGGGGGGGVCVEIPDTITQAAAGSCSFGFANINATMAPTAAPAPAPTIDPDAEEGDDKPEEDKPASKPTTKPKPEIEMSMRRLGRTKWLEDTFRDILPIDTDEIGFGGGVGGGGGRTERHHRSSAAGGGGISGGVGGLDRAATKRNRRRVRRHV